MCGLILGIILVSTDFSGSSKEKQLDPGMFKAAGWGLLIVFLPLHLFVLVASYKHNYTCLVVSIVVMILLSLGVGLLGSPILWLSMIQASMIKEGLSQPNNGRPSGFANEPLPI